jgi:hypothetical protein
LALACGIWKEIRRVYYTRTIPLFWIIVDKRTEVKKLISAHETRHLLQLVGV